ncbi:MAG: DUF2254 domain-containing protein [Leptolyngbyaceae cyanobacterium RM2_2_4]|nr:DUF2254 domain-containing protein [Leptolyngbyaceae cyanobacterium RM2_2_4]
MKVKLFKLWDSLNSSYWFLPALMTLAAFGLAFGTLTLDRAAGEAGPIEKFAWSYAGGPEGARTLLSTVAGSMITTAGTVFSITIVALTLASTQFGPRMLRNFMQDRGNQVVLGTFVTTFMYCLLILRTVRGEDSNIFVPQISVTVAIGLAIASIGVLIYFIHHASTSIQAWHVLEEVNRDLNHAMKHLFPETLGESKTVLKQRQVSEIPAEFDSKATPIPANQSGYLQAIDEEKLMAIAQSQDLLLRLKHRPGKFINPKSVVAEVYPGGQVNPKLARQINDALILGSERNEKQDIEFPINQLVEIALRAISPSINDPFTAIRCIDRLTVALCHLATVEFPSAYRYDDDHNLRIITNPVKFTGLIDSAFNQIRQYGRSDSAVTIRLIEAIAAIASHTDSPPSRKALLRQATMIERGSHDGLPEEQDRQEVREQYLSALRVLK